MPSRRIVWPAACALASALAAQSPPSALGSGAGAPCTLTLRTHTVVATGGAPRTLAASPSVAVRGRNAPLATAGLVTGNRFAAHSADAGQSWTPVDPATKFAVLDGGFAGNQRAVYEPSRDIALWCLQYAYSAGTQRGSVRVAVAREADFASNVWSRSLVFAPQDFGRPAGERLELTDMALSDNAVYFTADIFAADGTFRDAVVWRMKLDHVKDVPTPPVFWWVASAGGGGASLRLAHGAGETMRVAAHAGTTALRIWENPEEDSAIGVRTVPIAPWSGGAYVARAPNGVNWAGRIDGRLSGGYATCTEYGFAWTAPARTGRPLPHVRIARFAALDGALIGEEEIWSNDLAWMYPALIGNAAGHRAIVLAVGDGTGAGTLVPTTAAAIVDDCRPTFAGTFTTIAGGDSSPASPEWGDYYTLQRHPVRTLSFVAAGSALSGGGAGSNHVTRFAWFGRERDDPSWSNVAVKSGALAGVPIALRGDRLGRTVVPTPGYASHAASEFYDVTAPAAHTDASGVWAFCNWRVRLVPYGNWIDLAAGQRNAGFPLNAEDDQADAVYVRAREIAIGSRRPTAGVPVTLSRADVRGDGAAPTPFSRFYKPGTSAVVLTASATHAGATFRRWWLDGVAQALGVRDLTVAVPTGSAPRTAEVEFDGHVHGTFTAYGAGCPGSNARVAVHFSDSHPDAGAAVTLEIRDAAGPTNAALFLGFSRTVWNGNPLPLSLAAIGGHPACAVLAAGEFIAPLAIGAGGTGAATVGLPADLPLGSHVYSQAIIVDPAVASPLKIVVSNGLDAQSGGG
jgi:hypothetical protein